MQGQFPCLVGESWGRYLPARFILRDNWRGVCADRAGVLREREASRAGGGVEITSIESPWTYAGHREAARLAVGRSVEDRRMPTLTWTGGCTGTSFPTGTLRCRISFVRSLDVAESPCSDNSSRTVDAIADELSLVRPQTQVS